MIGCRAGRKEGARSIAILLLLIIGITLGATHAAYAYIDPGLGSILLQSVIASIAVAGGVVTGYWHRIKAVKNRFHHRNKSEKSRQDPTK